MSAYNGTYDQPDVRTFESTIGHKLAVNSHFHPWNDTFPWADSTSNPNVDYAASGASPVQGIPTTPYDVANTDEEDDAVNGRYVLTTWNCGNTTWNVAHGVEDAQIIDKAERFKQYGKPIFVRYFHEMNLDYSSDGHTNCLDGIAGPPAFGTIANLSGDTLPTCSTSCVGGYFNPGEWKAAWIHVHDLVRSIAPNVNFVFVPGGGGMGTASSFDPHMYYPVDRYVEWIGFDDYERRLYGTFDGFAGSSPLPCAAAGPTPGPTYYCPNTIHSEVTGSPAYTQVPWQSPTPKPLFVAETAAQQSDQATWLRTSGSGMTQRSVVAQTLAAHYPQISAFSYFDALGAINWVLTGSPASPAPAPNGYSLFSILAGDSNSAL